MDKSELRKMLDEKVAAKVEEGYEIPTYAMDVATTDRVKRQLGHQGHAVEHEPVSSEWDMYLTKVESGTYVPRKLKAPVEISPVLPVTTQSPERNGSSTSGTWKARRH